jgi:hypothetical protein
MSIHDIAADLVALCKAGKFDESGEKYWADDVVSIEAMPGDMARVAGKAAVRGKGEWWAANNEVHGFESPARSSTATSSRSASRWT